MRFALENNGLSPEDVPPTGPNGILTKHDVVNYVASGGKPQQRGSGSSSLESDPHHLGPAPAKGKSEAVMPKSDVVTDSKQPARAASAPAAAPSESASASDGATSRRIHRGQPRYRDIPVSNMRRVIAKRLLESKLTTPAIYMAADAQLEALTQLRATLKATNVKVSVNDFVIKAVAAVLRKVPGACAGWDAQQEAVRPFDSVDISIAVATEGGLITPIVKGADALSLQEISKAVKDLAGALDGFAASRRIFCPVVMQDV